MSHAAHSFLHRASTFASLQAACMFAIALPRPAQRFTNRASADALSVSAAVASSEHAFVDAQAALTAAAGVVSARESDLRPSSVRARRAFGASF